MKMEEKVVYRVGDLVVVEFQKLACHPCRTGWRDGTLKSPKDGGEICTHGRGDYGVGKIGPRGGWTPWGPGYKNKKAAMLVVDAFVEALGMPPEGRD